VLVASARKGRVPSGQKDSLIPVPEARRISGRSES